MKKKILTVAVVVVLIAIMVGGTLAYFTDNDEVTNTFTIGSVKIDQHEKQYDENGNLVDFEQNKTLLPIVNTENPSADPNYQDKIVTVENTGNNDAYIRTWIAIPKALKDYLILDVEQNNGWVQQWVAHTVEIDGVEYICYVYVYNHILTSKTESPVLLKGVYLDASVDVKDNPTTESTNLEFCKWNAENKSYDFSGFEIAEANGEILTKVNVLVATQAVQAQGFEDDQGNPDFQGALNIAHGDAASVTSVPWYVAPENP